MSAATESEKVGAALAQESGRAGVTILDLRYGLEDRPAPAASFLFGLQHVLIIFTALFVSPLLIGQWLNLPPDTRTTMVTGVMLGCGAGTVISALGIGWVGSRLPLLLGAYTVYIVPIVAMARVSSLAAATSALLLGGVILFAVSPLLGKLRALFPPVVVCTLLVITAETVIRIGVNVAAGLNTPYAGQPITLILIVVSVILILL